MEFHSSGSIESLRLRGKRSSRQQYEQLLSDLRTTGKQFYLRVQYSGKSDKKCFVVKKFGR